MGRRTNFFKEMMTNMFINRIFIIFVMMISFIGVAYYVNVHGTSVALFTAESFYEFYTEEQKFKVQQEVLNHIESIQYETAFVEDINLKAVKHEIQHLGDILSKSEIKTLVNFEERRLRAVNEFEEIVEFDSELLYFVLDLEGNLLRSGTDKSIDGSNISHVKDINGKYIVEEILEASNHPEGIFTSYYWPKVVDGEPVEKTSYCLYLPEFDFIIGAGVYTEDIIEEVKGNIYNRLNAFYSERENYLFVYSNDGTIEVGPNDEIIGSNANDLFDLNGNSIHQIFLTLLEKEKNGFVTYDINRKGEVKKIEKISFIAPIEEWDVYIGMGFYTEDIKNVYNSYSQEYEKLHTQEVLTILAVFVIVILIVLVLIIRGNRLQQLHFDREQATFKALFEHINDGIVLVVKGTIVYLNEQAEYYLKGSENSFITRKGISWPKNSDGIYMFDIDNDRIYFDIVVKAIHYKGKEASMFYLKNVSETYQKMTEYKELTLIDELTDLPNRRALKLDYMEAKSKGNCKKVVGLIDLDKFKIVNDTYGHDIGDQVLIEMSRVFKERLRNSDKLYRYGGEEFVIVLSDISLPNAHNIISKINQNLNRRIHEKFGFHQTFSGGLVETKCEFDLESMIKKADDLLYMAKDNGRNLIKY